MSNTAPDGVKILKPTTKPKNNTMAQAKKAVRQYRNRPVVADQTVNFGKAPSRPMRDGYEAGQTELLARIEREVTSLDTEMETVRQHALDEIAAIEMATEQKLRGLDDLRKDRLAVGASIRSALLVVAEDRAQRQHTEAEHEALFKRHVDHIYEGQPEWAAGESRQLEHRQTQQAEMTPEQQARMAAFQRDAGVPS